MEQRSDTAAQRALLAEDLGRQKRAVFFLNLLAKAAQGLAWIGRRDGQALVGEMSGARVQSPRPQSGTNENDLLRFWDPYFDVWMQQRILAWSRDPVMDGEDRSRPRPESRPVGLNPLTEATPVLSSANDEITQSAA